MTPRQTITLALNRALLEHPQAVHLRRMRMALWLYLVLLGRLPRGVETLEVKPAALSTVMGLPEGTVRSWLGHLRKGRYVAVTRTNGTLRVTMKRLATPAPVRPPSPQTERPSPAFTVARLARALGEKQDTDALAHAIANHPTEAIQRALAGALAVPDDKIRRSRTALFLYLLKRHAEDT